MSSDGKNMRFFGCTIFYMIQKNTSAVTFLLFDVASYNTVRNIVVDG